MPRLIGGFPGISARDSPETLHPCRVSGEWVAFSHRMLRLGPSGQVALACVGIMGFVAREDPAPGPLTLQSVNDYETPTPRRLVFASSTGAQTRE